MYTAIDRTGVQQLMERGAQLVEVLPESAYDEQHLPGAISLPLAQLDTRAAGLLLRGRPVIVYCYDYLYCYDYQ
jgi:rhodanese-related sulfurtransferase